MRDNPVPSVSGAAPGRDALRHGDHAYEPGVDADFPELRDPRWCNTCGEALTAPLAALDGLPDTPGEGRVGVVSFGRGPACPMPGCPYPEHGWQHAAPAPAARPAPDEGLRAEVERLHRDLAAADPEVGTIKYDVLLRLRAALAAPDRAEQGSETSVSADTSQRNDVSPEGGAHRDTLRRLLDALNATYEPEGVAFYLARLADKAGALAGGPALAADPVPGSAAPALGTRPGTDDTEGATP